MEQWIEAQDFIAADVIRWREGVFHNRRKGKALRIGERQVAAEVLHPGLAEATLGEASPQPRLVVQPAQGEGQVVGGARGGQQPVDSDGDVLRH